MDLHSSLGIQLYKRTTSHGYNNSATVLDLQTPSQILLPKTIQPQTLQKSTQAFRAQALDGPAALFSLWLTES